MKVPYYLPWEQETGVQINAGPPLAFHRISSAADFALEHQYFSMLRQVRVRPPAFFADNISLRIVLYFFLHNAPHDPRVQHSPLSFKVRRGSELLRQELQYLLRLPSERP